MHLYLPDLIYSEATILNDISALEYALDATVLHKYRTWTSKKYYAENTYTLLTWPKIAVHQNKPKQLI